MTPKKKYMATATLVILIGIVFAIGQYLRPVELPIEDAMNTEHVRMLIENGIPEQLIRDYPRYSKAGLNEVGTEIEGVVHGTESKWKIYFDEIESLNGEWYSREPGFTLRQGEVKRAHCFKMSDSTLKTSTAGWMSIKAGASEETAKPWLTVVLTHPDEECRHSVQNVQVSLKAKYPVRVQGANKYVERTKTLERRLKFFVISKEESLALQKVFPANRVAQKTRWFLVLLPIFISLCLVGVIYATYLETPKYSRI